MKPKKSVSVYNYTDYRKFLVDFFNEQKRLDPKFSYRKFAQNSGYNSSGLLIDVIKGRTNIHSDVMAKFARGLGLSRRETEYFESLVQFNQVKDTLNKNMFFTRMLRMLAGPSRKLHGANFKYYSHWYYPAIRELLSIFEFRGDYSALAHQLQPSISAQEAKGAISFLSKHGLIKKDETGRYTAVTQSLTSPVETHSLNVANFQRNMMDLAKQAIDRFPPEQRNISTLTFSVSSSDLQEIKDVIDAARTRIRGICENSKNDDMLCQLNIQLFPLIRTKGRLK